MKFDLKKIFPHLIVLFCFMSLTGIYFFPLFQGDKIYQGDIINFKGMSQELSEYRIETGQEGLWTNRMFGGMPAYQISHRTPYNLTQFIDKLLRFNFPREASFVLLSLIGFYILLLSMKIEPCMALVGAFGFGLSTYLFIIIEAGHNTKAHAISYMAPVLAGIIMAYRGKLFFGAALTSIFLALQLKANHLQISYYLLMMVLLFGVFEFINAIKEKNIKEFLKIFLILVFSAFLAIGANFEKIWTTYEYGKYSTRSQSELSIDGNQENKTSGLNKDYVTSWSYGIMETFNLLIPNLMGGASGSELSEDSEVYRVLKKNRVPNTRNVIKRMPTYWGPQPFTSGPVYIGSIICFLFVLGSILVKGRLKWWLLTCTFLSFLLAWGNNMMWITDIFLDYVPGYNKFRTVSMILVIAELTIPFLGFLAIKEIIYSKNHRNEEVTNAIKYALIISTGLCFMFAFLGIYIFDFVSPGDSRLPEIIVNAIKSDRAAMLRSDSLRSLFFILLSGVSIYLFHTKKITLLVLSILLGVLILADMLPVNYRYLNGDDFVKAKKMDMPFKETAADSLILSDKELNFRVYNTVERIDAGARTSFFHNNIGGYHGAKLKRYQELIDLQISKGNRSVLNMLNTKYFLRKGDLGELVVDQNISRCGAAWFVETLTVVKNADEEMSSLSNFNPLQEAFVDQKFIQNDAFFTRGGKINLHSYKPNHLVYNVNSNNASFAVFSEIFYDKGWNAYVDGKLKPHYRVNYVLRGMNLPKGQYDVEFKFEPKSVSLGSMISLFCSVLIYLFVGLVIFTNVFRTV